MIQNDPEKLKQLEKYVDEYARIHTITRKRANITREDREYDEKNFSREFKNTLDEIIYSYDAKAFRKYLGPNQH